MEDEQLIELKRYLDTPNHLIKLEENLLNVESDFFQTHSLIGGMMLDEDGVYQRGIDPYSATVVITSEERMYKKKIERAKKRYKLFADEFTTDEIDKLKQAVNAKIRTLLVNRACEWIEEINYYLKARYDDYEFEFLLEEKMLKNVEIQKLNDLGNEFEEMMRRMNLNEKNCKEL